VAQQWSESGRLTSGTAALARFSPRTGRNGVTEAEPKRGGGRRAETPPLGLEKRHEGAPLAGTDESESSEETPDANEQDFEWVDSPAKQAQERQDEMEESGQENPI
jgi:hypothetical protein